MKTNWNQKAIEAKQYLPSYHEYQKLTLPQIAARLELLDNQRIASENEALRDSKAHFYFQD